MVVESRGPFIVQDLLPIVPGCSGGGDSALEQDGNAKFDQVVLGTGVGSSTRTLSKEVKMGSKR